MISKRKQDEGGNLSSPDTPSQPPPRTTKTSPSKSSVEVPVWSHEAQEEMNKAIVKTNNEKNNNNNNNNKNDDDKIKEETAAQSSADNHQQQPQEDQQHSKRTDSHISANSPAYDCQVDLHSLKDAVYFLHPDWKDRLSRFWTLLILAAIIATSGIVSDSPATVIGAMIVAPLMTPILGTMLSLVLTDGRNFGFSVLLCLSGIGSCILIGYIYGLSLTPDIIEKENNSQVAGRVQPKLPDLIGAIATGAVGSIALVRKDIAGALPGVAISISLVPPLCVAGLMGSIGQLVDMGGALLLFITNFMSIQVTGVIIMYWYRVHKMSEHPRARVFHNGALILLLLLGLVSVPLAITSRRIATELDAEQCIKEATDDFFADNAPEWESTVVIARHESNKLSAQVFASGPPPIPQLVFGPMMMDAFTYIDGYPYTESIETNCPDVFHVTISYLPQQKINLEEL